MNKLPILLVLLLLLASCKKTRDTEYYDDKEVTSHFILNNPIIIYNGNCAGENRTGTYLCLDSVLTDSRCPEGVYCFWAGEARVRFNFSESGRKPVSFVLSPGADTSLAGYKFTFRALLPYPSIHHVTTPDEYRAEILIEESSR